MVSGQEPTDGELLGTLGRDPQVVGVVYDRYALRLVRYLQECGASEEVAMDATQEAFARLIVHHRRIRPGADGTVWPWLAVTGRNLLRDWQRRGTVEARARQRLGLQLPADDAAEGLARLEATRLSGRLQLALGRLTPEQRSAVKARVLDEHDYPQIAEKAGASEQTIRRLGRCRHSSREGLVNLDDALSTYRSDLIAAAHRWQVARQRRRRRVLVATSALALAGVIVGTAIATTGWLIGAPAPRSVKSDFGSYASQLGFNPQPGKSVLVASNGAYRLYATTNKQGGYCVLVSAPWKRPGPHGEGGDCSSRQQASTAFWAVIGGATGPHNGRTILVIDGRTTQAKAASLRFATPDRNTVTVPVGSSGFFIVGITTQASWCRIGRWAPHVAILDGSGREISTATGRFGRGTVCSSKPTPTVTTEHGHRVFTLQARPNHYIDGYIARARLGDRITCRLAGSTVTLAVPIHRAHTARHAGQDLTLKLNVERTRDGRVWVLCG